MNDSITYSELRSNLKTAFDKVCDDHIPLLITRQSGHDIVIISKEDYDTLDETAYLMRSPKNARRLKKAIKDVEQGRYCERMMIES